MGMNKRNWLGGWPVAVLMLALYWIMAVTASCQKSTTFDEIAHLTAGYSYWKFHDYRLQPENGNLPQRWAAIPLMFDDHVRFPSVPDPMWERSFVCGLGHQFFHKLGNDLDRMLWRGRAMIGLLGAVLGALVFAWSRQLFGVVGGLVSLTLFVFCPTMLAHGALITSDMAAGLFFLAACWAWWRLLHHVTVGTILVSGMAVGLLFVAKMSALMFPPMAALMIGARLFSKDPLTIQVGRRWDVNGRWRQLGVFLGPGVTQVLVAALVIWAFYGFRFSAFHAWGEHDRLAPGWPVVLDKPGAFGAVMLFFREYRLLPEAFLYGFSYVYKHSQIRSAFLNGEHSLIGWVSFFPYCLLVKTPVSVFVMLGLAMASARFTESVKRILYATAPLWIMLCVYGAFALTTNLNLGQRHLLPTYPVMYVLAGAAGLWFIHRRLAGMALAGTAMVVLAVESLLIRPDYLAYFNYLNGGPRHAYRHLVDSSLDWGQDLPGLRAWLDRHDLNRADAPVYLSYFGTGDPAYYQIKIRRLPGYFDLDGRFELVPMTGGIYCISATMLQAVYNHCPGRWALPYEQLYQRAVADLLRFDQTSDDPPARKKLVQEHGADFWNERFTQFHHLRFARLCAFLRQREPDDHIGYSILIYRLTDEDVQKALFGSPVELTPTVQIKGWKKHRKTAP